MVRVPVDRVLYGYRERVPYQFPVKPHDSRSNGGYPITMMPPLAMIQEMQPLESLFPGP